MSLINYVVITSKSLKSHETEKQWYYFSSLINRWNLKGSILLTRNSDYYDIKKKYVN